MPTSQKVTGFHSFDFPLWVSGGIATELFCACRYVVNMGLPGITEGPPPGEPPDPPEILQIKEIQVEVRMPDGADVFVDAPLYMEPMIRAYLQGEGAQDLIEEARTAGCQIGEPG